jgi:hypothetical protein
MGARVADTAVSVPHNSVHFFAFFKTILLLTAQRETLEYQRQFGPKIQATKLYLLPFVTGVTRCGSQLGKITGAPGF